MNFQLNFSFFILTIFYQLKELLGETNTFQVKTGTDLGNKVSHYCKEVRPQSYWVPMDDADLLIVDHYCNDAYECRYLDKSKNLMEGQMWNCPPNTVYPKTKGITDHPKTPECVPEDQVARSEHACGKQPANRFQPKSTTLGEKVSHYCQEIRPQSYFVPLDDEDILIVNHYCNDAYECRYLDKATNLIEGEMWNCPNGMVYPRKIGITQHPNKPNCIPEDEVIRAEHACGKMPKPETTCLKGARLEYIATCSNSSLDISSKGKPDFEKLNIISDYKYKVNAQNKRILTSLITMGIYGRPVPEHQPNLAFRLLAVSGQIFRKLCAIVPSDFTENAFSIFHDLHFGAYQGRSGLLSKKEYKWILKLLNRCEKDALPLRERTDHCGEEYLAVENCTNFVCTSDPHEFKLFRTDPLVDIIWKVFEMVHALCFEGFEQSYRMFHKYAVSVLHVWNTDMVMRWYNQIADHDFWKRSLGPNYEMHLINLERCNEASISRSGLPYRLTRETVPVRSKLIGDIYRYRL